jgi:hypothetical protein
VFDVFVNYRKADARLGAAAIYELLAIRFGEDRVFLDNQSMRPGSVYPQLLREALESMRVLLVLIGPHWLATTSTSASGLPIRREKDWVRREIRHAFARSVPVVPVLLDDAEMPSADMLPGDVRQLVYRQFVEVRHRHFGADVRKLADVVDEILVGAGPPRVPDDDRAWPKVHDIDDPVPLGVHPSPLPVTPTTATPTGPSLRVPAYIPRDAADRLAWAVSNTSFVLVVGDATAGKSRMAYEVVRERLPDHWFVTPDGLAGLPEALAWAARTGDCVVWLDDIERYLGPDGLTVQTVTTLSTHDRHVVLLGTIRSQEHAQLSPRWESHAEDHPGRPRSRLGRDVVRLAHEIHLDRRWSGEEIHRASTSADPRVRQASRHAGEFGVAEYLAAGPQLLAEWHDAWSPGNHPRAAALVAAAVDAERAGVQRGVSVDMLRRLHGRYLTAKGGATLRPEPFDEALAWATQTLHATSSLLVPAGRGRYRPFGYLTDAVDTAPERTAIREDTWHLLVNRMPAAICWHIGEAAYARRQLNVARAAFQRAAAAGNRTAELKVADCVGESGPRGEALIALREIIDVRIRAVGPHHPDVLEARLALAGWTGRAGDPRAAVRLLTETVAELTTASGRTHPDTLAARHALANWLGRAGWLADAIAEYRNLARDRRRQGGADHPHTLTARQELANWLGRHGDVVEAVREHDEITTARKRVLGADHPDTLRSRHRHIRLICQVHGADVGLPRLVQVAADRERVLGPEHPDTLRTKFQCVRWTGKAGRFDEAVDLADRLVKQSTRALGDQHPDTLRARHQQARWLSEAGDHDQAVTLLQDLIARWTHLLGPLHPYTLISRYRLTRAVHGTGARAEATTMLEGLLADDLTALGAHHPYTKHAEQLLDDWTPSRS